MDEYLIKLKDVLRILDVVMSDDSIKHKGKAIRKRLKELPVADVVEAVRCKDCEHFAKNKKYRDIKLPFSFCEKFHHNITTDSDFCSYGVRKEGVDNG